MKKIVFTLLIAMSSSVLLTACTEEEIAPSAATDIKGAVEIDEVKR